MSAKSPSVMGSVATPRRPISNEIYRGEDLRRTSPRAGAYDAFTLPSVMGGRLVTREQQREELLAPLPPAPPVPIARSAASMADPLAAALAPPPEAPEPQPESAQPPAIVTRIVKNGQEVQPLTPGRSGSLSVYRPRPGSGPHAVLQHLQAHGGHLLYTEICARFNIDQHSLTAIFKPALVRGALIRVQVGTRRALALPGYVPPSSPAPAPSTPAAAATATRSRDSRIEDAMKVLEHRRALHRTWVSYVDALQWRALTLRLLTALPINPDETAASGRGALPCP